MVSTVTGEGGERFPAGVVRRSRIVPRGSATHCRDIDSRLKPCSFSEVDGCPRSWFHLHTVGVTGSSPVAPTNPKHFTPLTLNETERRYFFSALSESVRESVRAVPLRSR